MPEPHATTLAGVATGSAIGLAGTIFGAQAEALLIGLMAAILISFWLPTIDDRKKAAASVALSALVAGYGAPVAAAWVADQHAGLPPGQPLQSLLALLIGIVCPTGVPALIGWAKRKVKDQ